MGKSLTEPRSRAEAIAQGATYWIVPEAEPKRTLQTVEEELAECEERLLNLGARAKAIREGYEPIPYGPMRMVMPRCEAACAECSMMCSIIQNEVKRLPGDIERLKVERAALLKRKRATNVIALDDYRTRRAV